MLPLQANLSHLETLVLNNFRYQLPNTDQAIEFFLFPSHIPPRLKNLSLSGGHQKKGFPSLKRIQ
ncbi:hypothetical protein DL93DRAFT_2074680 [Clavulina sp. PMI_390]|nr:hypothetical protein DL93DRAFT_2074680 [Clavulina sp. PMI_390]